MTKFSKVRSDCRWISYLLPKCSPCSDSNGTPIIVGIDFNLLINLIAASFSMCSRTSPKIIRSYFLKSIFNLVISPTVTFLYLVFKENFSIYSSKASTQSMLSNPNGFNKLAYVPAPAPMSKILIDLSKLFEMYFFVSSL